MFKQKKNKEIRNENYHTCIKPTGIHSSIKFVDALPESVEYFIPPSKAQQAQISAKIKLQLTSVPHIYENYAVCVFMEILFPIPKA